MKTKEKNTNPPREKTTNKPTGTGKGSLVEKNPMADTKERTSQTNNLGKFGEVQQENRLNKEDEDEEGNGDEPVKDNVFLNQQQNEKDKKEKEEKPTKQKPDSEEMNESEDENFEEEGYKKESKD